MRGPEILAAALILSACKAWTPVVPGMPPSDAQIAGEYRLERAHASMSLVILTNGSFALTLPDASPPRTVRGHWKRTRDELGVFPFVLPSLTPTNAPVSLPVRLCGSAICLEYFDAVFVHEANRATDPSF